MFACSYGSGGSGGGGKTRCISICCHSRFVDKSKRCTKDPHCVSVSSRIGAFDVDADRLGVHQINKTMSSATRVVDMQSLSEKSNVVAVRRVYSGDDATF